MLAFAIGLYTHLLAAGGIVSKALSINEMDVGLSTLVVSRLLSLFV
ncbi:hypothetical protein [Burkholderia ubonensis]|nr:hypothetical protein [Burkholderia ubonensis]